MDAPPGKGGELLTSTELLTPFKVAWRDRTLVLKWLVDYVERSLAWCELHTAPDESSDARFCAQVRGATALYW
jgi:hypothetical protein